MCVCVCVFASSRVKASLFCCLFLAIVSGDGERERERERKRVFESLNLSVFHRFVHRNTCTDAHTNTHASTCTHTHTPCSCKTTWLPAASPPASSAARDLARLIIFLLIECRGTLQGWVIKLMQRMFVSTVYLPTAKRYIRHPAHTDSHTYSWVAEMKNDAHADRPSLSLSPKHM